MTESDDEPRELIAELRTCGFEFVWRAWGWQPERMGPGEKKAPPELMRRIGANWDAVVDVLEGNCWVDRPHSSSALFWMYLKATEVSGNPPVPLSASVSPGDRVTHDGKVWLVRKIGWLGYSTGDPHACELWDTDGEILLWDFRTGEEYDAGYDIAVPAPASMPLGPRFVPTINRAAIVAALPAAIRQAEMAAEAKKTGQRTLFDLF